MDRPPAPPEAVIIRLAREAAGIPISDAAKRAGVSVARWSQIEAGSEMRHGAPRAVTGRAGTIARMAHAVPGVTPERMETGGQRPDAAEILREMLRDDPRDPAAPAPPADDDWQLPRGMFSVDEIAEMTPLFEDVRSRYLALAAAGNADPSGHQMYPEGGDGIGAWNSARTTGPPGSRKVLWTATVGILWSRPAEDRAQSGLRVVNGGSTPALTGA